MTTIDVENVEPKMGSINGGTLLSITGKHFGSNKENIKVKVAGVDCKVVSVDNEMIKCRTGVQDLEASEGEVFPGWYYFILYDFWKRIFNLFVR